LPEIQKELDGRYADFNVEALAISTGDPDWYLSEFKNQLNVTMPWLMMDTRLPNPYYQDQYDLWGLNDNHPTLVVLDANGVIRYRGTGDGGVAENNINYRVAFNMIGELLEEASDQDNRPEVVTTPGKLATVGSPASDFTLYDMNDNPVTLSDYRGTVIVIDFWSWGCAACGDPNNVNLKQIFREYTREQVTVLSVNLYPAPVMEEMEDYIGTQRIRYPVMLRGQDTVGSTYGITHYPTLMMIDKDGVIRYREVTESLIVNEDAQATLDSLVAELGGAI
jgi:peroxiredoxin